MGLYTVEKQHIEQLNSINLVKLLKKLLHLEAKNIGIPLNTVSVTFNICDPDEGADGQIKWENGASKSYWIPNRFTVFQSKAENMPPKECAKELFNGKKEIKPKIKEVLDAGGSYVFFCHKANSDSKIKAKIKRVLNELNKKGCACTDKQIYFYGADQISDWVNQYFPSQVFVHELLGRHAIPGLQTWEKWKSEFENIKYYYNDKSKDWIGTIRETIAGSSKNIIRITGLSGLGKTRLALEALKKPDDILDVVQASISESVIYYRADLFNREIERIVTDYRDCNETTFIIDECDLGLHDKLAQNVRSSDSNINLVTICNEPDYSQTNETHRITLVPDDFKNVVKDMLKDIYTSKLSENDIAKIAEFAGGFPVIATHLAKARFRGGSTLELTDDNLVRKILWGQNDENTKKLAILQACSIFEHFRLENDSGKIDEQAKFICDTVVNNDDIKHKHDYFCSTIKEFSRRKIIQIHGRYYRIEPVPLALRLARQWWESAMLDKIKTVINEVESKGLLESFCEQSKRFDFIPQAADLVDKLCGPNCPFDNAEVVLSVAGSRIFRSFAEVNPQPVADCIFRVVTSKQIKADDIAGDVRRNLVWTLEKLCWYRETFEKSAVILKILALAENEKWSNNATGIFLRLFHIALPGTKADLSQRQYIINGMISSNNAQEKKLAIEAVKHVFKSNCFSRNGGVESQGTRSPERDYLPNKAEVEIYWKTNLRHLTDIILLNDATATEAMIAFASISSTLIYNGYIDDIEQSVGKIIKTGIFWHDMLLAIEKILIRKEIDDGNIIKRLKTLAHSLEPHTWPDKIRHYISMPDWLHYKDEAGHYVNQSEKKAESVADELSKSDELWASLHLAFEGEQRQGFTLGKILAHNLQDVHRFIKESIDTLEKCKYPNLSVLNGFLSGLHDDKIFMKVLMELAKSKKLVCNVPKLLHIAVNKNECINLILQLLRDNTLAISDLNDLRYGTPINSLEPNDAMSFCGELQKFGVHGARQALEILYMYCFGTPSRFDQCKDKFLDILSTPKLLSGDMEFLDIHTWSEVMKKFMVEFPTQFIILITNELIEFCASEVDDKYSVLEYMKGVAQELLITAHDIVWPYFGNALLERNKPDVFYGIKTLLEIEGGCHSKTGLSPLEKIPYDYLCTWCKKNIPHGPAEIIKLLPIVWEQDTGEYRIDGLSRSLLKDFGNYDEVQQAATTQLFSFMSCGSREPYYLRRISILRNLRGEVSNMSLKNWIDTTIEYLTREAQRAKLEYDEYNAGIIDR